MRQSCWAFVIGLSLVVPGLGRAQQPPPPPPPIPAGQPRDAAAQTQKSGTARLSGRVTSLDTGRPIRRAVVRAFGPELREGKSVSTDSEGRWELRELPAGRFTVGVTKGGYVSLAYGQQRPFEAGKAIDVADGQTVDKLDVALPRGSAVTGRVVDEFGEPLTNVRVAPMRYRFTQGQRRLVPMGTSDSTDDLGQFRLHGLAPGEYYIAAQPIAFMFVGNSDDRTGYGETFYPGTPNADEAARVTLAVGQEAQNILIPLAPIRVATISGTATTSDGKPIAQSIGMLRPRSPAGMSFGRSVMVRDGAWSISGIPPGDYQLMIQQVDMLAMERVAVTGSSAGIGNAESAIQQITVSGDDIRGIAIVTAAGGQATGRIRFEGSPAPPPVPSGASVQGYDPDNNMPMMFSGARVSPDWTFELKGLVGRRLLRPIGLPAGWTVKAITVDGTDITDAGMEFRSGQEVSDVEVLATRTAAEVSGAVQNAKGTAVADYVVVVFPPEPERWGWQSRFVRVARPDQTGRFVISGLPPASYLAVALEYLEPGEESSAEFLERLKPSGTGVRVAEGEKKSVTLKLSSQ
jgi:hypothetical protein